MKEIKDKDVTNSYYERGVNGWILKDTLPDGVWIVLKNFHSNSSFWKRDKLYRYVVSYYSNGVKNGVTLYYNFDDNAYSISATEFYFNGDLKKYELFPFFGEFSDIDISYIEINFSNGLREGISKVVFSGDILYLHYEKDSCKSWEFYKNNIKEQGIGFPNQIHELIYFLE
jgi:hypothetical protein